MRKQAVIVIGALTLVVIVSSCNLFSREDIGTHNGAETVETAAPVSHPTPTIAVPVIEARDTPTPTATSVPPREEPVSTEPTVRPPEKEENPATRMETILTGTLPEGSEDPYRFEPINYTFESGETYTIVATSTSQFHSFSIDEFGINLLVNPDESVEVTFTVDVPPGTYRLYCLPHQTLGMVADVTVT